MAKILIVDDSPVITKLLGGILGTQNYEVAVATDAISAVTVAQREKPDLIILDLGLPGGDGFLLMRRFKNLARLSLIPVIVLSGDDSTSIKERALQAGAEAFFTKTPNNEELLAAIQRRLGKAVQSDSRKPQDPS